MVLRGPRNISRSIAYAPYQCALRTRAGTDALAFAVRTATDTDPDAVILSLDGIGAHDHIRRNATLGKLLKEPALRGLLPYVRQSYGQQSTYLWTDADGEVHEAPVGLLLATWVLLGATLVLGVYTDLTVGVAREAATTLLGGGS